VVAQAVGQETAIRGARSRQKAHDQGDASAVNVVDVLEIEQDNLRVFGLNLRVGSVKGLFCEAVYLAAQVQNGCAGADRVRSPPGVF
jgi:hypothetical protein